MQHRASRPLVDFWHRLPRVTARLLGAAAGNHPARALLVMTVALTVGVGGFLAVASVIGGHSDPQADSAGPGASRGDERPKPTSEMPASDGRTPHSSSSEPDSELGTSASGQPESPSPTSDVDPALRSMLGQVTGSPGTETATPSASPSQASATASTTPGDVTPPQTSLSEEFPAVDIARFLFSADESASFTCSLDGAAYTSCDSPTRYSELHPGWHTFAVRATDAAGNIDPSPAETDWHVRDGHSILQ